LLFILNNIFKRESMHTDIVWTETWPLLPLQKPTPIYSLCCYRRKN